jgi:NitT/TauT family transport system substrate-binding protein
MGTYAVLEEEDRMTRTRSFLIFSVFLLVACSTQPASTNAPSNTPPAPAPSTGVATTVPQPSPQPSAPGTSAATGPLTVVRTGYVPVLISAPYYIAVEKGYFKDAGIDLQLEPLQGGSDAVIQLTSGNFDVAAGGAGVGFWNAVDRGVKFVVVSPLHTETAHQATPLVTSKANFDSGKVKSAADLKGKKVAVNAQGSATDYWLDAALRTGGLTIKDVDYQVVAFADVPAALQNGAIDAAMLGEPITTQAEDKGLIVRIADNFIPNFQVTSVYFNADFPKNKPQAAQNFMLAFLKGCRDLQGDGWKRDENAKAIEKYTKVPADVIKRAATPTCEPNGQIHVDDFMRLQALFMQRGQLTYAKPIEFKTLVDTSYVERALQVLGPYKP